MNTQNIYNALGITPIGKKGKATLKSVLLEFRPERQRIRHDFLNKRITTEETKKRLDDLYGRIKQRLEEENG